MRFVLWSAWLALSLAVCFALGPAAYIPVALMVGIGFGIVAVAARPVTLLVGLISLVATGLVWLGELVWVAPEGQPQWRVVTLNVDSWNADLEPIAAALAELDADFLFLQEAWSKEHFARFQEALPAYHGVRGHGGLNPPEDAYDLAIFSRWPLAEVAPGARIPGALVARSRGLLLVNVHWRNRVQGGLEPWGRYQRQLSQAHKLRNLLQNQTGPTVLAGDFNAPPRAAPVRLVARGLHDARGGTGVVWDKTFPATSPLWRLDSVFLSPQLKPTSWRTFEAGQTDHLGVVVEMTSLKN